VAVQPGEILVRRRSTASGAGFRTGGTRVLLVLLFCLVCSRLSAAPSAPAYRLALPGYVWHFPQDHLAHPEFANEWWYFTGNFTGASGRQYGFELTFFRIAPRPGLAPAQQLYFAHFAISDLAAGRFRFHERARTGEWQQAGVDAAISASQKPRARVWNENWQVSFDRQGPRHLEAAWGDMRVSLDLTASGPPMLNGQAGWSSKGSGHGQASYYYSLPDLSAHGELSVGGKSEAGRGLVWMDHEFASNQLGPDQQGWDWIGLQLTSGAQPFDLLLFNLRRKDGGRDPASAGTLRNAAAQQNLPALAFTMTPLAWWKSPRTGGRYPMDWHVSVPREGLELDIRAAFNDQELAARAVGVEYWEGAVVVTGTSHGQPVQGRGYLEMTGYARPFTALQAGQR